MSKFRDLTGQRFGQLTVLGRAPNDKDGSVRWHCICECGTKREIRGSDLIYGNTRSCGCLPETVEVGHGLPSRLRWHNDLVQRPNRQSPGVFFLPAT
jgi:hypothetical protein